MAIDKRIVQLTSLNEYFVDKTTGEALSGGTLEFYQDADHSTPKNVYKLEGTPAAYTYTSLGAVITLSGAGTPMDAGGNNVLLYAFPYEGLQSADSTVLQLYHVKCFGVGDTTPQWTRDAIPGLTADSDNVDDNSIIDNQISNAQFSEYFLNSGANAIAITAAEVVEIAPNWVLDVDGSGTITVTQEALAGFGAVQTLPAYNLKVQVGAGVTRCRLRQRLNNNSGLWGQSINGTNTGYVASHFVAKADTNRTISFYYQDNAETVFAMQSAAVTSAWTVFKDSKQITSALSAITSATGYIDLYFDIPEGATLYLTSVQVIPTPYDSTSSPLNYDQRSSNRELALMSDYYIPAFKSGTKQSYLLAWDMSSNPTQEGETGNITVNAAATAGEYIWDHTIAGRAGTNVAYARNAIGGGLELTTGAANTGIYVMQYIDGIHQIKDLMGGECSIHVRAHKTAVGTVTCRVYFLSAATGSAFPTLPTVLGNVSTTGVFTKTDAAWDLVPRNNLPVPTFTLNSSTTASTMNTVDIDFGFNGWYFDTSVAVPARLAVIVTMDAPTNATVISIDSISLVKGKVPALPNQESHAQVLLHCQRYFEKSYNQTVTPGTSTYVGAETHVVQEISSVVAAGVTFDYAAKRVPFMLKYLVSKRVAPTLVFYDPAASSTTDRIRIRKDLANTLSHVVLDTVSTAWTAFGAGNNAVMYHPVVTIPFDQNAAVAGIFISTDRPSYYLQFHYTADARLGVV
jgi:hypothetical protein